MKWRQVRSTHTSRLLNLYPILRDQTITTTIVAGGASSPSDGADFQAKRRRAPNAGAAEGRRAGASHGDDQTRGPVPALGAAEGVHDT